MNSSARPSSTAEAWTSSVDADIPMQVHTTISNPPLSYDVQDNKDVGNNSNNRTTTRTATDTATAATDGDVNSDRGGGDLEAAPGISEQHRINNEQMADDIGQDVGPHTGRGTVSGRRTAILLPPTMPQQHTTTATVSFIGNKNRLTTIVVYPTGTYHRIRRLRQSIISQMIFTQECCWTPQ